MFAVNLLGFGFGTSVGWMSPVIDQLKSGRSPLGVEMDDGQLSWMGSLTFLGGILSTVLWGRVADRWGRKAAGYGVGCGLVAGWTVILFSSWIWALYVGRFLLGFGSGCFIVGPLYVTETVRDSLRGTLGSFVILFMNAGVVYAYALGAVLSYRVFTLACLTVPVFFLTCYFFLPETPAYLWSKNKRNDAERSLLWMRGGNDKLVAEEMTRLRSTIKKEDGAGYSSLFENRANRRATLIGTGLFFFQQFCGILVVLNYATEILDESGSSVPPGLATTLVGLFQLVSSTVSAAVADRFGRKILLTVSYTCMGLALSVLGLCFTIDLPVWLPFASLSFYVLTYPLGAGPLAYVVISETLAPNIRGLATSTFVLWGTANVFLTVKIYPWLKSGLGASGCFWFFAGWCIAGSIFVLSLVPETRGIPLDRVLAKMEGQNDTPDKSAKV